jgi:mono/diheme cytochrome c family protein
VNKYAAVVLFAVTLAGCREDMQVQPKYDGLRRVWFFPDGRSARPIPDGTIPFDETQENPALATGVVKGEFVTTIPLPVTTGLLERGQERFDIYCSPCHGRTGNGDGVIAHRGFKEPANLNGDDIRNAPPGYLYAVLVRGKGAMASYAYQIKSIRDRWAIIAYIRALELSRAAPLSDVPPAELPRLENKP